ncbi:VRR-NUC domain-containing protein [Candidatus Fermentibacteria bacterium]|nr:MAG: VRR-NUC domain-containing protein [Candidatus Fermentibacteria bacterium]
MSKIEAKIEAELVKRAKKRGYITYKLDQIPGQRNNPDQLIINNVRECIHVEVKRKDLKPRPAQTAQHNYLSNKGQWVSILDDEADIEDILNLLT